MPSPRVRSVIAIVVFLFASSCGPRDAKYDPSGFHIVGPIVPADLVLPQEATIGESEGGVYIASDAALFCCLMAPHALVSIRKAEPAHSLCVGAYVPDVALFRRRAQSLFVMLGNSPRIIAFLHLKSGEDTQCRPIPRAFWETIGDVRARLWSGIDYVPARAGTGTDKRHYAFVLVSIFFE